MVSTVPRPGDRRSGRLDGRSRCSSSCAMATSRRCRSFGFGSRGLSPTPGSKQEASPGPSSRAGLLAQSRSQRPGPSSRRRHRPLDERAARDSCARNIWLQSCGLACEWLCACRRGAFARRASGRPSPVAMRSAELAPLAAVLALPHHEGKGACWAHALGAYGGPGASAPSVEPNRAVCSRRCGRR